MKRLVVRTVQPILSDRLSASLLREQYLEPAMLGPADEALFCDLNGIRSLSPDAAFELVGKWLERLRATNLESVVFIASPSWDVLRSVHAALRDRNQACLGVYQGDARTALVPLGDVDDGEQRLLRKVAQHQPVDAHETVGLVRLRQRGLLLQRNMQYEIPLPEADAVYA